MSDGQEYINSPHTGYDASSVIVPTNRQQLIESSIASRAVNNQIHSGQMGRNAQPVGDFVGEDVIYNSYAGADIVAQIVLPNEQPITLGELQTFSYSIHRENNPVRLLGHTSPVGFTRGKRTVAGSMIFTVFNYYAFYRLEQFRQAIRNGLYPIADMLPPLDFVLTFANEFGVMSKLRIFGLTFIDEGQTMSIEDLITEQTHTYMARSILPMTGYRIRST